MMKVNKKINNIKENVEQNLSVETMPMTRLILQEALDSVNKALLCNDNEVIIKILKKYINILILSLQIP